MQRRTRERLPSLITQLSRVVRDKGCMTELALRLQARTARIKPGRLRWYCFAFFLAAGLGETWIFTDSFTSSGMEPDFSSVRAVVTQHALPAPGEHRTVSFARQWDSLMMDPTIKRSWDSLLMARPDMAETWRRLREMDSTEWKR